MTVASIENHAPVTTLGVVVKVNTKVFCSIVNCFFQAGSRNEEHSNLGLGHALRIAAGLGTKNNSAFGICRNLQQAGASLTCVQGREHTLYTIQATRDSTDLAADYLCDVVSNQAFKPWELERNLPRMKLELATKNPAADAVELLHQAAFRSGLGNSLFCAPHKVGSHSPAQLQTFVSKHFTAGRSALLGIGVNHASLAKFGELLNLESGSGPADVASKYGGGEVRTALIAFYKDNFLSPPYPARALHQHLTLLILESIQSSLLSKRCVLAIFSL